MAKKNPFSEKLDKAADKKNGLKENSKKDVRMDKKGR